MPQPFMGSRIICANTAIALPGPSLRAGAVESLSALCTSDYLGFMRNSIERFSRAFEADRARHESN